MTPAQHTEEAGTSDQGAAWNPRQRVDPAFRNTVWNDILGSSRKRDVFLAVRDLASERCCLEKTEIATRALSYPHFSDRDKLRGGDLGDNGDLEPLRDVGAVLPIPKIARPSVDYVVPFRDLCQYLVDPYHAPTAESVQLAIEYYRRNQERDHTKSRRKSGTVRDLPIDPFAIELYTAVRLALRLDIDVDRVTFTTFRPSVTDHEHARGFVIEGQLEADSEGGSDDDTDLMSELETLCAEYVEYAAHGKDIFRIGVYARPDDETDTRTDARRRAIRDFSSFETFNREQRKFRFRWSLDPVIML
ncbi:hypothetical protein ACFOZ7_17580 [Natribaculum luteum]|uniref:Uncharacterized protein n=1 Tax=Natribaculum luteum TaxID=1586232 RepID=A0ABD5P3K5_9EURY|nr:hypothetical protein [Natribaculum luteum]